jgi:hypothetical protein
MCESGPYEERIIRLLLDGVQITIIFQKVDDGLEMEASALLIDEALKDRHRTRCIKSDE